MLQFRWLQRRATGTTMGGWVTYMGYEKVLQVREPDGEWCDIPTVTDDSLFEGCCPVCGRKKGHSTWCLHPSRKMRCK